MKQYIITEGQHSKIKQEFLKLFYEIGIYKTLDLFKLSPKGLDIVFKNDFPSFNCDNLNDIIMFFITKNFIKKKYNLKYKNENYEITSFFENRSYSLQQEITNLDYMDGVSIYATPFFEGECWVPLEIVDYYLDEEGSKEYYEVPDTYFNTINDVDVNIFNSFMDIVIWYEKKYIKYVMEYSIPLLKINRNKYEKDELY